MDILLYLLPKIVLAILDFCFLLQSKCYIDTVGSE